MTITAPTRPSNRITDPSGYQVVIFSIEDEHGEPVARVDGFDSESDAADWADEHKLLSYDTERASGDADYAPEDDELATLLSRADIATQPQPAKLDKHEVAFTLPELIWLREIVEQAHSIPSGVSQIDVLEELGCLINILGEGR